MRTINTFLYLAAAATLSMGSAKAQCNGNFSVATNLNIPATALANQSWNNHTDGLYIWNWGDGSPADTTYDNTNSYPSITHNYTATGSYSICLNYQSVSGGCNTQTCQNFSVSSTTLPPKSMTVTNAGDSLGWINGCPTMPVSMYFYFYANVLGYLPSDTLNVKVSFGDGTDSAMKVMPFYDQTNNPGLIQHYFPHTYTTAGLFSAQYMIYDNALTTGDTLTNYNEVDLQDSCGNLEGYLYIDLNNNCQFDSGDSALAGMTITALSSTNNWYWTYVDSSGHYSFNVPAANTYTLSVYWLNNLGYAYTCGGAGMSGASVPSTVDIGVVCPASFDLAAQMYGWRFRPADTGYVYGVPLNYSCLPQNGTATLTLDPNTTYISEMWGQPVTVNGNQVSWNFNNLSALYYWWYWNNYPQRYIKVDCSPNLQIGDSVCYTLSVSPTSGDANPANNALSKCYPVKASWDPNFKEVYPRGVGAPGYVAQNTEFTYTIHFQNTGTAPAHNIAILDTIDADLDMNTFQVISASHYVVPHNAGNNLVKFQFNNIMLADSATDPVGSQGYVTYNIKAKPGQPGGTQYTNTAYIYFDFNPAVVTNTTLNTVFLNAVGMNGILNVQGATLAPNPASDISQLTLQAADAGIADLLMVNILGETVLKEQKVVNPGKNIFSLDVKNLAAGVYLLHVTHGGTVLATLKLVK